MDMVTDKRFLIGLAVGWLVVPYVSRFVTMQLSARKAPAAPAA